MNGARDWAGGGDRRESSDCSTKTDRPPHQRGNLPPTREVTTFLEGLIHDGHLPGVRDGALRQ